MYGIAEYLLIKQHAQKIKDGERIAQLQWENEAAKMQILRPRNRRIKLRVSYRKVHFLVPRLRIRFNK